MSRYSWLAARRSTAGLIRVWLRAFAHVLVSLVIVCLVLPYLRLLGSRLDVFCAKVHWQNNEPTAYQVTVWQQGLIDEPESCRCPGMGCVITVIGHKVTASNGPPQCQAIYEQLTIERSFDMIDQALREANPILASKPELELGPVHKFVTGFYISQEETLFSSRPFDSDIKTMTFQGFRVLDGESDSVLPKP